jgi:hypothetical protein
MTERRTGSGRLPPSQVWRWPIVLAFLTAAGLVAALLMEGAGDILGWMALLVPVVVGARALARGWGKARGAGAPDAVRRRRERPSPRGVGVRAASPSRPSGRP